MSMSSSIDIWRGPTPPPQLGPYHTSSLFLIVSEETSTGNPGPLGDFGLRLRHIREGLNTIVPIGQHLGSQSKPLVNTLLFTGRGDDVWSTPPDEPDMALHIRWDSPRVVCTRYGIFQVPHVILVNNTGTTLIRIDQGEDNPYRDLRGGESRELRSGAAVSIALPRQPLSPSASPPVDDLALPTEFMEVNARWDAENLADATGLGFWFVHCVRGTSDREGQLFMEVPVAHDFEKLPADCFIRAMESGV